MILIIENFKQIGRAWCHHATTFLHDAKRDFGRYIYATQMEP